MLRILHLAKYYSPFRGGIETHVRGLAQAQAAQGHCVTVACVNHRNANGQDVWSSRTAKTKTVEEKDDLVNVKRFGKFATFARFDFCHGIRRYLRNAKTAFDIVHLHAPNPVMTLGLMLVKPEVPIIVTYHSDIVKQRIIRKPFSVIEQAVFKRVSCFIVASQSYLEASDTLGRYRDRTEVIPYGLDLEPYIHPSPKAIAYRDYLLARYRDEPIWLTVGRLVYYKGTEYSIRALADCPGRLLIVGRGADETPLRQLATDLGVADRVEFISDLSSDELVGAYHAATAFWFPSVARSESFGLVQVEAMASGCPVINTNILGSGVSWVSLDNVSGWTVPPKDGKAIATAAKKLVENPCLRATISAGARDRAIQVFSIHQMVDRTNEIYESVLNNANPAYLAVEGRVDSNNQQWSPDE